MTRVDSNRSKWTQDGRDGPDYLDRIESIKEEYLEEKKRHNRI